jgi:hypothetical protein
MPVEERCWLMLVAAFGSEDDADAFVQHASRGLPPRRLPDVDEEDEEERELTKFQKEMRGKLAGLGYEAAGFDRNNHLVMRHPGGAWLSVSSSPGGVKGPGNAEQQLMQKARRLVAQAELEVVDVAEWLCRERGIGAREEARFVLNLSEEVRLYNETHGTRLKESTVLSGLTRLGRIERRPQPPGVKAPYSLWAIRGASWDEPEVVAPAEEVDASSVDAGPATAPAPSGDGGAEDVGSSVAEGGSSAAGPATPDEPVEAPEPAAEESPAETTGGAERPAEAPQNGRHEVTPGLLDLIGRLRAELAGDEIARMELAAEVVRSCVDRIDDEIERLCQAQVNLEEERRRLAEALETLERVVA